MKKYFSILTIILLGVFAAGCVDSGEEGTSQTTDIPSQTFSGSGISFEYPEAWPSDLESETPNSLVVVGDPESQDANGSITTLVAIQSTTLPSGQTLKETFDATYSTAESNTNFESISQRSLTLNGVEAYENIHRINVNGVQKQERAVWLEKNGTIYVILCGALPADFDAQQKNFDLIINSFKIQ
ncbi:MAG: hypothetical protein KKF16_02545 [Euryarchaeota archaeon]|nr:hypothetical protein [Euryarchaeota archaeon]MBU4607150.1 hypothetical protein [Euryarchaeota archaeon]MBV1728749.1 hypothetical protein [Methanobacterium sp.]MBV1755487.1 hypothetical protein [Methanobacterium sp.]MBV1767225.1 hypothetical protein [Methanobacterium sp.]